MSEYKCNKAILILIIIGLLTSIAVSFARHGVEKANRQVDMIYEYEEILFLSGLSGKPPEEVMRLFKESGITSLSIYENTLETLEKRGFFQSYKGHRLLSSASNPPSAFETFLQNGEIRADELYLSGVRDQNFLEIQQDLAERLGEHRLRVIKAEEPRILAVQADYESISEQSLSILTSDLKRISAAGLSVVPRPSNYHPPSLRNIKHVFARLDSSGAQISGVLFGGQEVLGYPDHLPAVAEELKRRRWTLGMTEHPMQLQFDRQAGLVDLAVLTNYQAARLYVIEKRDQERNLNVPLAVRRWALTDEERNVRMNLLRSFFVPLPGKDILTTNLEYVSLVRDKVLARGFTLGPAGVFEPYFPNRLLFIPIIFGAVAAGVWYLSMLTSRLTGRRQIMLTVAAAGLLSLPFVFAPVLIIRQAVAVLAVTVFPVLAMIWQLDNWEKLSPDCSLPRLLFTTAWQLAAAVMLSMIGGIYLSGILSDIRFFLEIDIYRGVKLTFLLPLLFITLIYLKRYRLLGNELNNQAGLIGQIKELFDCSVKFRTLVILGLASAVGYYFIARTGHSSGVAVPALEIKIRHFLEEVMYARPREKEFLVGHPAFFLAAFAVWRRLPNPLYYCLIIGATIGQSCLAQTFAHMRTPVLMSVVRALDGLLLGEILGIAALLGASLLLPPIIWLSRRYTGET